MLTCYLDDSNSETGPTASIAGYFTRIDHWQAFEVEADDFLTSNGVPLLHAHEFHNTKGPFRGWSRDRKHKFVSELYLIARKHSLFGVSASVRKSDFKAHLKKTKGLQNMSPLGMAFGLVVTALILKLPLDGRLPISLYVESGNANNSNILKYFHYLKRHIDDESEVFGDLTFIDKNRNRAIQLADFLAFHGRRAADVWDRDDYPPELPKCPILQIMMPLVSHHFERGRGEFEQGVDFGDRSDNGLLKGLFVAPAKGL